MSTDEIAILFQLYSECSSTEANLWMMYVAATLTCAGFGVTTDALKSIKMGVIASIGFIAFTVGQYVMVREVIAKREIIISLLKGDENPRFASMISCMEPLGLTLSGAFLTHAFVDACVVALIMYRPIHEYLKNKT